MDGEQTLEELTGKVARAWASIDGKAELFDKENGCTRYGTGTYVGYMADAEELLRRSGLSDAFKAMEAERDHVRFLANDAAERELAIEAENKKLRALIAIAQDRRARAMPIDRNHPLVGLKVVYTPNYGPSEEGVVTSVNEELGYVFVSYGNSSTSKASVPDRLTDMSGRRVRL